MKKTNFYTTQQAGSPNRKAFGFFAFAPPIGAGIGRTYRSVLSVWLLCFFAPTAALFAQTQFITKWDLSKTGASTTALTFGVQVASTGAATYTWNTVPAGTSGSGTIAANATSVTISSLPADAIIEVKINPTNFQRISISNGYDRTRLIDVLQWGTTAWTSMAHAFEGCNNLNITATDVPNLAGVTDMLSMFFSCSALNGPSNIGAWNTASVTNMSSMFSATAFNQDIGAWNTASVTNMSGMFGDAKAFNQNIGTWNTVKVTNMLNMFVGATAFNQNISAWNTAAVTNMSGMFFSARNFNQNIGTWNTAAVTNMSYMFFDATAFNQNISAWNTTAVTDMSVMFYAALAFNQNIGTWNTGKVTNMSTMFASAIAFDQDISAWNTAAVTNMSYMFRNASTFNQNISTWNTAAVTDMSYMFHNATSFNQNIGTWNTAAVTNMSNMFDNATAFNQSLAAWGTKFNAAVVLTNCLDNCGMSLANYEATLTGFAATTRTGRALGANNKQYCNTNARTILTNPVASGGKGWTITGDVQVCTNANFVTRWDLSKTGTNTTALTFGVAVASTGAATYTWNTIPAGTSGSGTMAANATSVTITGLPANTIIEVKINPTNFQRININNGADKARLVDVSQWGTTAWTSMATAFYGCNNLNITATDVPTLTSVTSMSSMFSGCTLLNGPSNIGTWNTAAVTDMSLMFSGVTAFNQDISVWNVAAVTNMTSMLSGATAFNQDISAWNVAAVTNMTSMLSGATAFNQSLAAWGTKFNAAVVLTNCLDNCGMSLANYEATLTGFAATTRTGRSLGAAGLQYCDRTSRTTLINLTTNSGKGWTITGDIICATSTFNTRWDLSKTGTSTTALTFGVQVASTGPSAYTWTNVGTGATGSGTLAASATTLTISGLPVNAIIDVKINPTNFQRININNGADRARLVDVSQWGTTAWTSMATAFYGCNNLNITATDVPNLAGVTNMSQMFQGATAFNQDIGAWNIAAVTNMTSMLSGATAFNQSLAAWGTKFNTAVVLTNCLDNCGMSMTTYEATLTGFAATTRTGRSLGAVGLRYCVTTDRTTLVTATPTGKGWTITGDVKECTTDLFITRWDLSKTGTSTTALTFGVVVASTGATAYSWTNVNTGATGTGTLAANATTLTISGLPVNAIIDVKINPTNFQRININNLNDKARLIDVSQWGTTAWTSMATAFYGCTNLANITATDVPNLAGVTNMSQMFQGATAFNQDISAWNVGAVTNMTSMFQGATAFNQDIGAWNIAAVTNMTSMLSGATAFKQSLGAWGTKFNAAVVLTSCLDNCGMSVTNYEATLTGFAATTRTLRSLGAAGLKYCSNTSITDRTTLVTPTASGGKGWTITGDVKECTTDPFITRWDLSKTGTSTTALTFGVVVASTGATAYSWTNVNTGATGSGTLAANATTLTISGLPVNAIIDVKINPTNFQRININNGADRARLVDVSQWGTTAWTSMATAFYGCTNLANITATDVPNLAGVTNMSQMFQGATAFNQDISAWNVGAVTSMTSMFQGATAFNQDIGAWNIAAVTNMTSMLSGATGFNQSLAAWGTKFNAAVVLTSCLDNCGMSVANYEATLTGFAATTRTLRSLGAAGLKYCSNTSITSRTTLVTPTASGGKGWTITGDVKECTTDLFITRWDLSKTGTSTTALTFGVVVASTGATAYSWTNVNTGATGTGTLAANATTLTISGLPVNAIIDVKINPTNFQRININNGTDRARLVDVSQWGTTAWTSMATAFYGCTNLANITATDVPNLAGVTNMSQIFSGCTLLNGPSNIGTWNTAAVTNMSYMFFYTPAFNQNISAWNVAAVTNMTSMFAQATAFNQNISAWNVAAVTNMSNMFSNATTFNQNIGMWSTIKVTNMSSMFKGATAFNQDIGTWNTAAVTDMSGMFSQAYAFNQNIGTWNVGAVTNMSYMFQLATAFNQSISMWNTVKVTNMSGMFRAAPAFNQNIGTWNVTAVTNMLEMFLSATAFNQDIRAWNVAAVTNMTSMLSNATAFNQSLSAWGTKFNAAVVLTNFLDNCGMSMANYEATLTGFAATTRTGRSLGAAGLKYCNTSSRTILTTATPTGKGWTITGDVQDCATSNFVTRWDLSKSGGIVTSLTFGVKVASTGAAAYTWNTVPAGTSGTGTIAANATSVTISGLPVNAIIEVKINPTNFQRINIENGASGVMLVDVSQWGTTAWTSMATAFYGCNNLNITATDVPNLAGVTDMSYMFYLASTFNQDIGTWNTAAVTNMSSMFYRATAFNQNIGTWNTAAVTNMLNMFYGATAFNQNIGTWNTAAVTNMLGMFGEAPAFNQNIGTWNTAAVKNMSGMFYNASTFNQNISSWNTAAVTNMLAMFYNASTFNQNIGTWNTDAVTNMSQMFNGASTFNQDIGMWNTDAVTNMSQMFSRATAFNQNISTWNIAAATNMSGMFQNAAAFNQSLAAWGTKFNAAVVLTNFLDNCGMSMANYEATLTGFAATTRTGRSLGAAGLKYCNTSSRTILTTATPTGKGWTITGDVQDCATSNFVTRWDLSKTGTSTTALTFGVQIASTGAATYTWNTVPAGTSGSGNIAANATSVTISGLPADAIIEVKINPTNFQRINIDYGTDRERLVDVSQWGTTAWTSMATAFYGSYNLANITATDVPNLAGVTNMSQMFKECYDLNGPSNIGSWNTAAVTDMSAMFHVASTFNQNISSWNTAAVTNMSYMFSYASTFNQNISSWNTAAVTNMSHIFNSASTFNQNISSWNTTAVTNMSAMFYVASTFNQNISSWNTTAVTNMSNMFSSASTFNQDISSWNTAAVTDMSYMFSSASTFNQDISSWNTAAVADMSFMFYYATAFNQNIGSWNTAAVTNMSYMFSRTSTFNQDISSWNTAAVMNMSEMFHNARDFNQSLGAWGTKFNAAVSLTNFLDNCGMSLANYEATLTGFAATTRTGRRLGAAGLKYCNATNRTTLVTPIASGGKGWIITGDAVVTAPSTPTFTAGKTALCTSATSTYTATAANSSSITYSILNGTGASIDASSGLVSNVTGDFTVVATAANTCGTTTTANRAVTVNANVTPSVSIAASPSGAITTGTSVTFTATPTNGGATPAYQWKKGGIDVSGATIATYTSSAFANGDVITCVMTPSAEICVSATTATSAGITMTVNATCDCDPSCSPIPTAAGTYTATRSNVIGLYTHYCSGNNLLLSIKTPTNGTVVPFGAVKIKVGATAATYYQQNCGSTDAATSCFMDVVGGGVLINRFWHIDSTLVTGLTVATARPLQIVSYFTNTEYQALNGLLADNSLIPLSSPTGLRLYQPSRGRNFGVFADPSMIKPYNAAREFTNTPTPPPLGTLGWYYRLPYTGIHSAEFLVPSLQNSGGIGGKF